MRRNYGALIIGGLMLSVGLGLTAVGVSFLFVDVYPSVEAEKDYSIVFDDRSLTLDYKRDGVTVLSTNLVQNEDGLGSQSTKSVQMCSGLACASIVTEDDSNLSYSVEQSIAFSSSTTKCYEVNWVSTGPSCPVDCFPMKNNDFWFGGAEMYYQKWPINSWEKKMSFYQSGDMYADPQQYGSVMERYWLSSCGVAIYLTQDSPLHVSIENQQLCFKGCYEAPAYEEETISKLSYYVCLDNSPQDVHEHMTKTFIKRPQSLPDIRMMKSPIWSTWAKYKQNIDQDTIIDYAQEILAHDFTNSQLEIDDGYERNYGDHDFNPEKFPDPKGMISTLNDMGFRVTTWVTPFINLLSKNYEEGDSKSYFVKNGNTDESGNVIWWDGIGASIDFTNPDACTWYESLLNQVKDNYGVDAFKFDAGEINYVINIPQYKTHDPLYHPGSYTKYYAECAARFGGQIEVRAAWNNQGLPIFVRMMDKDSTWTEEKGIKTLIPTALTFSILGYPYILPDMIGGNAYDGGFFNTTLPERELFIRWLEVTAFLPAMQFSISPWQYDSDVEKLSRYYIDLHETVVFEELKKSSENYINGEASLGPIRPIWWTTDEADSMAYNIDDEFMVGDKYLIAPILEQGKRERNIYLPGPWAKSSRQRIYWRDNLHPENKLVPGGTQLFNYRIELEEISWWTLVLDN